jgi:hypothetical protein
VSRAGGEEAGASTGTLGGRVAKAVCNCFPAGTKVATASGPKAIQRIRVGDRVWARDLTTGRSQLRQVAGLFSKRADRILRINVAGAVISVTPQHPFYSPDKGWVDAGHLQRGDQLLARDGRTLTIKAISSRATHTTVYNFEVEGDHNYYITSAQLLVHNCAAGGATGGAGKGAAAADDVPRLVYRGGSAEPKNLTARPGLDPTGLSTYDNPAAAVPRGGKAQVIDTSKLKCVVACPDAPPPGHVSLRPPDPADIPAWAATRDTDQISIWTQDIMDAIVGTVRVPKP